jgi:putative CocE/NonD family hydrolase
MLGISSGIFQEWLSHPELGPYWDAYNPTAAQLARLQIPNLTVTGSYDDDQPGALEHYKQFMRFASPEARAHHYLIIGPWDHGGTVSPRLEVGGVKFGPASLLDLQELELQWYEWTMDHKPRPDFLKKQVAYYVMGAEHWRYADTLEAATATSRPFFLDSRSGASDVFSSGGLGDAAGKGEPGEFRYDPGDTSGREVEAESQRDAGSLTDQTVLSALNGRELVYHTAPFRQPMEITGFFKLKAWISLDRPDTDLYVSVYEITSDGNNIRMTTDAMRARYREGFRYLLSNCFTS